MVWPLSHYGVSALLASFAAAPSLSSGSLPCAREFPLPPVYSHPVLPVLSPFLVNLRTLVFSFFSSSDVTPSAMPILSVPLCAAPVFYPPASPCPPSPRRTLFTDSYYTSTELAADLYRHNTLMVGSLNPKRKWTPVGLLRGDALERNESRVVRCGIFYYTAYRPGKLYHYLSTGHPVLQRPLVTRVDEHRRPHMLTVPVISDTYARVSHASDFHNQLQFSTRLHRKSQSWFKYVFWHIMNTSRVNALLLFRHKFPSSPDSTTTIDFSLSLAAALIGGRSYRARDCALLQLVSQVHHPIRGDRECCRYDDCHSHTTLWCSMCQIPLCVTHFKLYHDEGFRSHPLFPPDPLDPEKLRQPRAPG